MWDEMTREKHGKGNFGDVMLVEGREMLGTR